MLSCASPNHNDLDFYLQQISKTTSFGFGFGARKPS